MLYCTNYKTVEAHQRRLRELNLCEICSNAFHKTSECQGNLNKLKYACSKCSFKHIPAVCDAKWLSDLQLRSLHCDRAEVCNQPFILPILNITVVKNNKKVSFNCLYDTGSQRSYFSTQVLRNLNFNIKYVEPVTYDVNIFWGRKTKAL